jgi:prepilin-type processing-associated H-X9-DG protein
MGTAWTMYAVENRGRLPEYIPLTPQTPDVAWQANWLGILDHYRVRGDAILCPAAKQVIPFNQNFGSGNVAYAWTGKYASVATPCKLNATTWRDSSYGYNRYMTVDRAFGTNGRITRLGLIKPVSNVPLFIDAMTMDFLPKNGSENVPVAPPPNLRGEGFPSSSPDHWQFLIARHGRGVNVALADGSARWVPLEETYLLTWKHDWMRYRLPLPLY